jgi:hypothetical protein
MAAPPALASSAACLGDAGASPRVALRLADGRGHLLHGRGRLVHRAAQRLGVLGRGLDGLAHLGDGCVAVSSTDAASASALWATRAIWAAISSMDARRSPWPRPGCPRSWKWLGRGGDLLRADATCSVAPLTSPTSSARRPDMSVQGALKPPDLVPPPSGSRAVRSPSATRSANPTASAEWIGDPARDPHGHGDGHHHGQEGEQHTGQLHPAHGSAMPT